MTYLPKAIVLANLSTVLMLLIYRPPDRGSEAFRDTNHCQVLLR